MRQHLSFREHFRRGNARRSPWNGVSRRRRARDAAAAAQRIGAQQARVKLGRQMHGITGDIPAGELELRSFTIGGVEVPCTTQRNAD